jgi:hypothetical protein
MTLPTGPLNALPPKTSFVVGAVYNSTAPTPVAGQACALQVDSSGNLKIAGSFSGGNAAAGPTGSPVPADADYIGFNSSGNLVGVSSVNPLPISGSISATNPSVGATGSPVPADATAIGVEDGSGNLQIASSANPVRVDPTGTTTQPISIASGTAIVKGNVASGSAVSGSNAPVLVAGQDGTDVRTLLASSTGQLHVIVDSGGGGGTQYTDETAETAGAFTVTAAGLYNGTDVVGLRGDSSNNLYVNVNVALPAGTNNIGKVTALGSAASGTAVSGNPVLIAGQDGTDARTLLTDNTGQLKVLIENTPAVTGSGVFEVGPTSSANTLSNQFFNQLTDGTHGVGINGSGYSSVYGLNVNLLGQGGAVLSASNPLFTELTDGTNAMGAMTNFGTTPTAVKALSANASLFQGTTAVGAGAPLQVSLANTGSNGTAVAVTGTITAITSITNPVTVVGDAANGLTAAGNPVLVAGWDGLYVRTIATDSVGDVNTTFYNVEADAVASASWTNATSVNTTLSVLTIGFGNATFGVTTTGTVTPGVLTFEATADGVNWVPLSVEGVGATTNPILTYTLSGGTAVWQMFVGGLDKVRIRLSTAITGGGTAVVWIRPSVAGTEFSQAVYQSTAANLNATVVCSGVFEVGPTTSANTLSNQFFNQLTDGTHGVTINSSTYTSKYGLDVNLLGMDGAVLSATNTLFAQASDGTNAMGAMTNFGSTPGAVKSLNANVSLFAGTTAVSTAASGVIKVGVVGNAGAAFDAATNAAPPANAVQVGMVTATALPSAYTATDLAAPMTDKFGRQVCLTAGMRDILAATGTTIASTTGATTVVAAVASTYCDITSLTITNSSATATLLTLSDGTNSYIFSAAGGPGWGITIPFNPPLPAASVNTAWTVACGTSVSSVYVVAQYIKNH